MLLLLLLMLVVVGVLVARTLPQQQAAAARCLYRHRHALAAGPFAAVLPFCAAVAPYSAAAAVTRISEGHYHRLSDLATLIVPRVTWPSPLLRRDTAAA
jgi:galactose-1-phosphate uridylyltransferase